MFIENKKTFAIMKALEAAAVADGIDLADNGFVVSKKIGNIVAEIQFGSGPSYQGKDIWRVINRNDLEATVEYDGEAFGGITVIVILE